MDSEVESFQVSFAHIFDLLKYFELIFKGTFFFLNTSLRVLEQNFLKNSEYSLFIRLLEDSHL